MQCRCQNPRTLQMLLRIVFIGNLRVYVPELSLTELPMRLHKFNMCIHLELILMTRLNTTASSCILYNIHSRGQHGCWQKSIPITNRQFPRWNIQLQRSVKIFLLAKGTCNLVPSAFCKLRTCFSNFILQQDSSKNVNTCSPRPEHVKLRLLRVKMLILELTACHSVL